MTNRLNRYWYAARYYRPRQILARLSTHLKQYALQQVPALGRRYLPKGSVSESGATLFRGFKPEAIPADEMEGLRTVVRDVHVNRFTFLNHTREFGGRIDWVCSNESRLWRYNLHYGDYILALALVFRHDDDPDAIADLRRIVDDWIVCNPVGLGIGWHAYPTSLRMVNWLYALHLCGNTVRQEVEFYKRMLHSLYSQAAFLLKHLEFDSLGNHLVKNAKALTLAGLCFSGSAPAQWLAAGEKILWDQLEEQILPDGGHYERSPMYHTILLSDYLEVLNSLRDNNLSVPMQVPEILKRMTHWLEMMLHPDGDIPLLQDSVFAISRKPGDVLRAAHHLLFRPLKRRLPAVGGTLSALVGGCDHEDHEYTIPSVDEPLAGVYHFSDSGYVVFQGQAAGDRMILDAGAIGPDHIPAHGHSGLFSFELSVNGQRVFVDSGVGTYVANFWRDYYRSTRAHNTVEVNNVNQSDVWSAFRAGRRARTEFVACKRGEGYSAFIGRHDGYVRIKPDLFHTRSIFVLDEGAWLILDRLSRNSDLQAISYFHVHPDVAVRQLDSQLFELCNSSCELLLLVLGSVKTTLVKGQGLPLQGWYAPEFGLDQPCSTLSVQFAGQGIPEWGSLIFRASWPIPRVEFVWNDEACEFLFESMKLRRKGKISRYSKGEK